MALTYGFRNQFIMSEDNRAEDLLLAEKYLSEEDWVVTALSWSVTFTNNSCREVSLGLRIRSWYAILT